MDDAKTAAYIEAQAQDLVMFAAHRGYVLTIEMVPARTKAMGSYTPEIGLRPVRGPAVLARIKDWWFEYRSLAGKCAPITAPADCRACLENVRTMSASHADKSRTNCGDAPDARDSEDGGLYIKVSEKQRYIIIKAIKYLLKQSEVINTGIDETKPGDGFSSAEVQAAKDIMRLAERELDSLIEALQVRHDPPVTQFQLADSEVAILIEALDGQASMIRAVLASLERERGRQNERLPSSFNQWVAEEAMGERLKLIAELASQLQKASTQGRVLVQYSQR